MHVCAIAALLRVSYTTYIIIHSCSIVSVIVVGAFCSGVSYEEGEGEDGQVRRGRRGQIGA